MRNLLNRCPSADPKPSLRERFAGMKAKAAGLAPETSQGRRAMLAGALATTLPLPALAASNDPSLREAAFLALVPEILPTLRQLGVARIERHRLYEAGDVEAGPHPGWDDREAGYAWAKRARDARETNGYHPAWNAANALAVALASKVDPFINEPMRTLPGIMLKAALNDLGDWWEESATADVAHLAAEHFGLPAPAPFFQGLAAPDDDEDGTSSAEIA